MSNMSNLQMNTKYIRRKFTLMVKMTLPSNGPGFGVLLSLIVHPIKLFESETCQVADAPENYSNPPWQQQKYAPKDVLVKNCPTIAFGLWSEIRRQISCMFLYHIYSNYILYFSAGKQMIPFFPLINLFRKKCLCGNTPTPSAAEEVILLHCDPIAQPNLYHNKPKQR